jgi:hypothetical protein
MRGLRALHARPAFDLAVGDPRGGRRRFHRRMGEMGDVILRRDFLCRLGHGAIHVAARADGDAGLARGLFEGRAEGLRIIGSMRAVVPGHAQGFAPLDGCPGVAGDDRHAAHRHEHRRRWRRRDLDHLLDARHLHGRGGVIGSHLAAHHRRTRDDGVFHAGQADILPIDRATRGDVEAVDDVDPALADVAEFGRVLEAQLVGGGHRHRARIGRELAIAELVAGGLVDHLMIDSLDLRDIDAPAFRGGAFEHHARRGAAFAHRFREMARRARAVGVLIAEFHLVARRLRDLDARPIGLELVGDDQRHAGAHALAHFRTMANDGDSAVRRDRDEGLRIVDGAMRHAVGAEFRRILGTRRAHG